MTLDDTVRLAPATPPPPAGQPGCPICPIDRIVPDRGVAALVQGHPVAVFLLSDGLLAAVDHIDPFADAPVMARGLVGSHEGRTTVASPLLKQRFDLVTGQCLDSDDRTKNLAVHTAFVADGWVYVRLADIATP